MTFNPPTPHPLHMMLSSFLRMTFGCSFDWIQWICEMNRVDLLQTSTIS